MNESFIIPVVYEGEERQLECTLIITAYVHKFHINVDGVGVYFEPDEERNYRAMLDEVSTERNLKPDPKLIKAIADTLGKLLPKLNASS